MDRRDRNFRDREDFGHDSDRYEGYSRNDEHYHRAINLTDEFERDFQRERGHWDDNRNPQRIPHTYHEGDDGDAYERLSQRNRRDSEARHDWDRNRDFTGGESHPRDYRYGDRAEQDRYWSSRDRNPNFDGGDRDGAYPRDDYRRDDRFDRSRYRNEDDRSRYSDRDRRNDESWYSLDRKNYDTTRYY